MSPGKACAQVAHAATQHATVCARLPTDSDAYQHYAMWADSAKDERNPHSRENVSRFHDFGTTIVLGAPNLQSLNAMVQDVNRDNDDGNALCGVVVDPSYPIADGEATVFAEVATVGWAFIDCKKFNSLVSAYSLY